MQQYQRWYCYECREYAPNPSSQGKQEEKSGNETEKLAEGYTLGIVQGSRVDAFCFGCKYLRLTQNNTRLICANERALPKRYSEPLIHDVTIRPSGTGMGRLGVCFGLSSLITRSTDALMNMAEWQNYFEEQTKRQIESHEKVAASVEMYRIDFLGSSTQEFGARVIQLPVNRESLQDGIVVVIERARKKRVWIHFSREKQFAIARGDFFIKFFMTEASVNAGGGYMEDCFSPRFLRDALKRDVESFAFDKINEGSESSIFWSVINKAAHSRTPV